MTRFFSVPFNLDSLAISAILAIFLKRDDGDDGIPATRPITDSQSVSSAVRFFGFRSLDVSMSRLLLPFNLDSLAISAILAIFLVPPW
jgi:hypothetical protein